MTDDNVLICRCEEVTLGQIRQAIKEGARDVTGVKRRTRAGMGLCQGNTCERLILAIIKQELGTNLPDLTPATDRPPVMPLTFGVLGGERNE